MLNTANTIHTNCGCDLTMGEYATRRTCPGHQGTCGALLAPTDMLCDPCLDDAMDEEAAMNDHYDFEPLQHLKEFLAFAEASGAFRAEALEGLRANARAYATQVRGADDRYIRRLMDTAELVGDYITRRCDAAHEDYCRCANCLL